MCSCSYSPLKIDRTKYMIYYLFFLFFCQHLEIKCNNFILFIKRTPKVRYVWNSPSNHNINNLYNVELAIGSKN
jgi:hypothetical protein